MLSQKHVIMLVTHFPVVWQEDVIPYMTINVNKRWKFVQSWINFLEKWNQQLALGAQLRYIYNILKFIVKCYYKCYLQHHDELYSVVCFAFCISNKALAMSLIVSSTFLIFKPRISCSLSSASTSLSPIAIAPPSKLVSG